MYTQWLVVEGQNIVAAANGRRFGSIEGVMMYGDLPEGCRFRFVAHAERGRGRRVLTRNRFGYTLSGENIELSQWAMRYFYRASHNNLNYISLEM